MTDTDDRDRRIALGRRAMKLEAEFRQQEIDVAHWNRAHPDEEPIVLEPLPPEVLRTIADVKALLDG